MPHLAGALAMLGVSITEAVAQHAPGAPLIELKRGIRILNARVRGYKVGIRARDTRLLTLVGNDLSNNWKPRLYSLVQHESLADWPSFHHNEKPGGLRRTRVQPRFLPTRTGLGGDPVL